MSAVVCTQARPVDEDGPASGARRCLCSFHLFPVHTRLNRAVLSASFTTDQMTAELATVTRPHQHTHELGRQPKWRPKWQHRKYWMKNEHV